MKKQLPGFLTGIIVSALVFTAAPAIAAQIQSITATLNSVNIEVNGQKVAVSGENYTLDNGKQTAGSIVYNETTYVPIRKFGEIMGAEIGWNQETRSVTVAGDVKAADPTTTPTPDTALSDDYSTWTAEEEAAYQEFKGMWEVEIYSDKTAADAKPVLDREKTLSVLRIYGESAVKKHSTRMMEEWREIAAPCDDEIEVANSSQFILRFWFGGAGGWAVSKDWTTGRILNSYTEYDVAK